MIRLTRLNHVPIYVNSDLIEHVEVTPDTVIALTSGQRFMVLESADEVVNRVLEFRRAILAGVPPLPPIQVRSGCEEAAQTGDAAAGPGEGEPGGEARGESRGEARGESRG